MIQNNKKYFIKNDIVADPIPLEQVNYHTEQPIKNEIQPLPGEYGFGVAVNDKEAAKIGLKPMLNHKDVKSENFGNYTDENGSVFVCIPRFYYKINQRTIPELDDWNEIEYSIDYKEGFVTPLAFRLYHGSYLDCVFVAKYQTSMENFKLISKKNTMPAVLEISKYRGATLPENHESLSFGNHPDFIQDPDITLLYTMHNIVKKQNKNLQIHHNLLRFVYILTCLIHVQNCYKKYSTNTPGDLCGFMNKKPYFPRGMNGGYWDDTDRKWYESGWTDVDDNTVTFTPSHEHANPAEADYGPALTGSSSDLTKTSHNGQLCGIQDLNGNAWETDMGLYLGENILIYDAINASRPIDRFIDGRFGFLLTTSEVIKLNLDSGIYTSGKGGLLCGDMFRNYFTDNAMYFYPDQITDKYNISPSYNKNKFGGDWQDLNSKYDFSRKETGSYTKAASGEITSLSYGGRQRNGPDNGLYTATVNTRNTTFKGSKKQCLTFTGFEANTIRLMMYNAEEINYENELYIKLISTPSQLIKLIDDCELWCCGKVDDDIYMANTCFLDRIDNVIIDKIPEIEQNTKNLCRQSWGENYYENYLPELDGLCSALKEKLNNSQDFIIQKFVIEYIKMTEDDENITIKSKILTPQMLENPSALRDDFFNYLSNIENTKYEPVYIRIHVIRYRKPSVKH